MKKTTKKKVVRKAGLQPGSKKFEKILAIPATADEFQAAYNFTPEEIAFAQRILEKVRNSRRKASGGAGR